MGKLHSSWVGLSENLNLLSNKCSKILFTNIRALYICVCSQTYINLWKVVLMHIYQATSISLSGQEREQKVTKLVKGGVGGGRLPFCPDYYCCAWGVLKKSFVLRKQIQSECTVITSFYLSFPLQFFSCPFTSSWIHDLVYNIVRLFYMHTHTPIHTPPHTHTIYWAYLVLLECTCV